MLWGAGCETLPAPALHTLRADLVASIQTLAPSSLTPSVLSSFWHFCSFSLTTGSPLSAPSFPLDPASLLCHHPLSSIFMSL